MVRQRGSLLGFSGLVIGLAVTIVSSAAAADGARILLTGSGDGVVAFETVTDPPSRGSCTSSCAFPYSLEGLSVTLRATPARGSRFVGWGGLCASAGAEPSCSVTGVAGVNEVSARFDVVAPPKTTITAPATKPKPKPATSAPKAPAPGPPPRWKLVVSESVIFSVRGTYVSGHAEVRLAGVQLPAFKKGKKHLDFQKGGRSWVLGRHTPRNIRLLYRGQILNASQSLQMHEVEPAIQHHFYFTPKGAARPVFSVLGRGTGTLVFTTDAGSVRMPVPVSIVPYGS